MPHSLLVVHANTDDRGMYAEYLRDHGFSVIEVGTTDEALPKIGAADVIITGLLVPGSFDGVELIEKVRQDPSTSAKPIIVVTACALREKRAAAQRAGCDVFLLKPCVPDVLVAEVLGLLGWRA